MSNYKRKCKNWLLDFGKWTLPRSEAPETFIFWTGLFTIASALRRRVYIPKRLLGSWECAPNIYVLFVAKAGMRKTTTSNYALELIDNIPAITLSPDLITKESLLSTIVQSDDASMCINAGEFGEFIVKSGVDMYSFLTNAYDGKKRLSASTLSRGLELAEKPCVNLLGATTPEWISHNMPEHVIGGGFASRVIFIYETQMRRREIFYDDIVDHEEISRLHDRLLADLTHISSLSGEFDFTPDGKEYMREWYKSTVDSASAENYKMHGYFERRPAHILKIAMCLKIAENDELLLDVKDIQGAIELLKQIEVNMPKTFAGIGKNPYMTDMERILQFIKESGGATKEDIFSNFMHVAEPSKLQEIINGLVVMGEVSMTVDQDSGDMIYIAH